MVGAFYTLDDDNQNGKTVLSGSMKLIPISQIPENTNPVKFRQPIWILIERIKSIPAGKALVVTKENIGELGTQSFTTARVAVPRYARSNLIPGHFKAIQRKSNGEISIYIANLSSNDT